MTLPTSGEISFAQIAAEYGLLLPITLPGDLYGKPGLPTSGPITVPGDLYGKSNVAFTPDGGHVDDTGASTASVTLTCTQPATWTFSGGGAGSSVSIASGSTATSITFTINLGGAAQRSANWSVHGEALGIGRDFDVSLYVGSGA